MAFIVLIWVIPIPLSIGPFLGLAGRYDYNSEVFFCEQGWTVERAASRRNTIIFTIVSFVVPFLVIAFLNWSVYKVAKNQINALEVQMGNLDGPPNQQEMLWRISERKAAVNISIIIAAFVLCFVPAYIVGLVRQFTKSIKVPGEVVLAATSVLIASSVCNPIIYAIHKRDFRTGVKKVLRRIGICGNANDIDDNLIGMNDLSFRVQQNLSTSDACTSTPATALDTQHQDGILPGSAGRNSLNFQRKRRLSPIPEVAREDD